MDKGTIVQRAQMQAEFDSQVWQIMSRIKRGHTVPNRKQYKRVMAMLEARAKVLYHNPSVAINTESDWLALALFAEDSLWFADMCVAANDARDVTFSKACQWLGPLIDERLSEAGI